MSSFSVKGKKSAQLKSLLFDVVLEPEGDGRWTASCPALSGCVTWGNTKEEAFKHIQEAIDLYIEDLVAAGEPIPAKKTTSTVISILSK